MARKLKSDRILFTAAVLLVCVSVVMVYSASAALALDRYGQAYMFLTRQAMWTLLGLVALAVSMRIDYRTYRNEAFIWSLTGAVCVLLVLVLFSAPINGARRWFNVGGLGIQPSNPSWGAMLARAYQYMEIAPEQMYAPGIAILLTALAFNALGESLRVALDPTMKRR